MRVPWWSLCRFTTIVRTCESKFRDTAHVEAVRTSLKSIPASKHITQHVNHILCVDNPPQNADESPDHPLNADAAKRREDTRTYLFAHLHGCNDIHVPRPAAEIQADIMQMAAEHKAKEQAFEQNKLLIADLEKKKVQIDETRADAAEAKAELGRQQEAAKRANEAHAAEMTRLQKEVHRATQDRIGRGSKCTIL